MKLIIRSTILFVALNATILTAGNIVVNLPTSSNVIFTPASSPSGPGFPVGPAPVASYSIDFTTTSFSTAGLTTGDTVAFEITPPSGTEFQIAPAATGGTLLIQFSYFTNDSFSSPGITFGTPSFIFNNLSMLNTSGVASGADGNAMINFSSGSSGAGTYFYTGSTLNFSSISVYTTVTGTGTGITLVGASGNNLGYLSISGSYDEYGEPTLPPQLSLVPEPSAFSLLAAGLGMVLHRRRRTA